MRPPGLNGGHGDGPEQQPHHADGAADEAALQDGVQRKLHILPDDGLRLVGSSEFHDSFWETATARESG